LNREYELFYVLRPDIDEDQVRTAMDDMAGMIGGQGGEMTKSSLWGRRRLAYTIAGFNDGYYVLKELTLPAEKVRELERHRRGRVRTRVRDRGEAVDGAVPGDEALTDDALEAEIAADDGFGADLAVEENGEE
jgi:small subunit ribosomal protein S6